MIEDFFEELKFAMIGCIFVAFIVLFAFAITFGIIVAIEWIGLLLTDLIGVNNVQST